MRLKDRVALVTGGGRGIGKAIALALAKEGADLGINYVEDPEGKNARDAKEVADSITEMGRRCLIVQANVAGGEEVAGMVKKVIGFYGKIDILVNNAGITRDVTLKQMARSDWDEVINVNLNGVFYCTREVINYMRDAGYGRIISLSSIVGQTGNIGQSNYAASKAAVMGFTKSVAREVARKGITVNAVAPGFIQTTMIEKIPDRIKDGLLEQIPAGRFGTPDDIARVVVFLALEDSSYVTGQVIHVNGGLYM